jgi:hypothetical protein
MPHIPFASSTQRARSHFVRSRQRQGEASYSRQQHRHQPQLCSFEEARASSFPAFWLDRYQILRYGDLVIGYAAKQTNLLVL